MEREECAVLLEIIEQQLSSFIPKDREAEYDELEEFGYIRIHDENLQRVASITPLGKDFLRRSIGFK